MIDDNEFMRLAMECKDMEIKPNNKKNEAEQWKELFKSLNIRIEEDEFQNALLSGDIEKMKACKHKSGWVSSSLRELNIEHAVRFDKLDVVKLLVEWNNQLIEGAFLEACHCWSLDILQYLYTKINPTTSLLNEGLSTAANGGCLEILNQLIEWGASDVKEAFSEAVRGDEIEVMKYLYERYDDVLRPQYKEDLKWVGTLGRGKKSKEVLEGWIKDKS